MWDKTYYDKHIDERLGFCSPSSINHTYTRLSLEDRHGVMGSALMESLALTYINLTVSCHSQIYKMSQTSSGQKRVYSLWAHQFLPNSNQHRGKQIPTFLFSCRGEEEEVRAIERQTPGKKYFVWLKCVFSVITGFLCWPDSPLLFSVRIGQSFYVHTAQLRWEAVRAACSKVVASFPFCVIFSTVAMWHRLMPTPQGHDYCGRPIS